MSDPAVEAVRRSRHYRADYSWEDKVWGVAAAREALKPLREQHRPVAYINRQRCCVSCFDQDGKPHLWPCVTALHVYPSEELSSVATRIDGESQ